ncbi:MAG: enoyl-CoA hydratase-related protein [Desulfobacterales bacterium]|jgi:enoyl-CoA hydratase|nr:enoyl-CoA hydratase-related protein [Desulfobacterales bacterium]
MFNNILFDVEGGVAVLTINRPDKMNAVNHAAAEEIAQALDRVENEVDIRVLILTGAGEKSFVSGADIDELKNRNAVSGRAVSRRRQELYSRIENLEIPSIAAINGYALGTGLEMAMACSIRMASSHALLGQPEVKLGIIPGAGGTQRLPKLVGMGRAMELILTGNLIKADQALAMGLVNHVVAPDQVMIEAKKMAATIANRPKLAVQYAKEAILRSGEGSLAQGLAHESYLHTLSCGTRDKAEGVSAFLEKRPPHFTGE